VGRGATLAPGSRRKEIVGAPGHPFGAPGFARRPWWSVEGATDGRVPQEVALHRPCRPGVPDGGFAGGPRTREPAVGRASQAGGPPGILVERQRLAREIHDTLAQGFTGVITNLTAAELTAEPHVLDGASARYVENAKRIARDSLAEARRLVWALRPESLDRYTLPEAVSRLVRDWSEQTGIEAHGSTSGTPRELLPEAEVALLRAAQESLTNVYKHARASNVNVTLTYMDDRVIIDVLDDGDGFDPAAITPAVGPQDERGFGLTAMRERVEQLGGRLAVETAPGEGTAIVVELRDRGEPMEEAR
jgi:signal transduction histidine kinase